MKKILLIGNSHVGAVKQASERKKIISKLDKRSINLTFCATVGSQGLTIVDKHVVVDHCHPQFNAFRMTSGAESIDLNGFDKVFLFGGGNPLNGRRFFSIKDAAHVFSKGLVEQICSAIITFTFSGVPFHEHMLKFSGRPVCWVPNPCEPELLNSLFKNGAAIHPDFQRAHAMPGMMHVFDTKDLDQINILHNLSQQVRQVSLEVCRSMGLESVLFPPKKLLLADGFRTLDQYSKGSLHFMTQREEPHIDPHMNADYGEHMLNAILEMS